MLKTKPCKHFKIYKAIYPPKCNCQPCKDKWNTKHDKDVPNSV